MKLLTPEEMAAADQNTFSQLSVPARSVMEVAGRQVTKVLLEHFSERLRTGVLVVCGGGNNGGDGYVVARVLLGLGVPVQVCSIKPLTSLSGDCLATMQSFLKSGGTVFELAEDDWQEQLGELDQCGVLVDAIFGTGFSGAVRDFPREFIAFVNGESRRWRFPIVSIDIPSGVEAATGEVHGAAVFADATVCLQSPKIGNVQYPGSGYCGRLYCADIGVSLESVLSDRLLVTETYARDVLKMFLPTGAEAHKGVRGHVAVIGGSKGHFGAPKLTALAALKCGAGLVTMYLPEAAAAIAGPSCQELMCSGLADDGNGHFAESSGTAAGEVVQGKAAVVIGPGLGTTAGAKVLLEQIMEQCRARHTPLVIDADALNIISNSSSLAKQMGPHVIITPHPGEMARLIGGTSETVQQSRLVIAAEYAQDHGCWVVLKGARTVTAGPQGGLYVNPAASPALATAGSGDVLAGILAACAAWGMPAEHASQCGVFLHGAAGELVEHRTGGVVGTIAGDLIQALPLVINVIHSMPPRPYSDIELILPGSLHASADTLFGS